MNEWWVFFVQIVENYLESVSEFERKNKMAESKLAMKTAIIKLEFKMNEFESDWISLSQSQNGVRVFLS